MRATYLALPIRIMISSFQFSIWDAVAYRRDAERRFQLIHFQFSIWDAVSCAVSRRSRVRVSLSILYLRCSLRTTPTGGGCWCTAFNSLFEMLGLAYSLNLLTSPSSFQFSIWDALMLSEAPHGGHKAPFNSLFEMQHIHGGYKQAPDSDSLSILYLRCAALNICLFSPKITKIFQFSIWDAATRRRVVSRSYAYRSFQFSIWDAADRDLQLYQAYLDLSILYLRCSEPTSLLLTTSTSKLSILYLRCREKGLLLNQAVVLCFQFSIWDAAGELPPGWSCRPRHTLSILYLRCWRGYVGGTALLMNTLSILYLRCGQHRKVKRVGYSRFLSILYLRCKLMSTISTPLKAPAIFQFSIWDASRKVACH